MRIGGFVKEASHPARRRSVDSDSRVSEAGVVAVGGDVVN